MSESTDSTPGPGTARLGPSPWLWMILGCLIVSLSGLARINKERLQADAVRSSKETPFPLKDLPRQLGEHWEMVGDELELDRETLQVAGCSDYFYREYMDKRTKVTLQVLVSFGPAVRIFPHSPIVCYPASGFEKHGGPWKQIISLDDSEEGETATFSELIYTRPGGGLQELKEVYYSFWHDGRWDPDAKKQHFYRHPGMFKVQVERSVTANEAKVRSSLSEEFIAALIPEINRRIKATHDTEHASSQAVTD
jgi:hypothetical protein